MAPKKPKLAPKSNCCPVIKLVCHMTKAKTVSESYRDQYTGAQKTAKVVVPPRRVCAVALGTRVVTGSLAPNKAGARINGFRKQLAAKGCNVKVDVSAAGKGSHVAPTIPAPPAAAPASVRAKLTRKATKALEAMLHRMY
jgi:hypothetical protein